MLSLTMPLARVQAFEKRHWLASIVLAGVIGLNIFAGASLMGMDFFGAPRRVAVTPAALAPVPKPDAVLPEPEPLKFQAVAPQDAVAINAAVPLVGGPNPAARPFKLLDRGIERARAIDCLTAAIYYEAATEPADGQRAVAQVVLNRVRHPAFANSVCGVVYQGAERATGCQFTFTCDGALRRLPMTSYWERARKIATEALDGKVYAPVGLATHYHTNWVVPYWSSSLAKIANVGTHIFYRWSGGWGRPAAFAQRYAGTEPVIDLARLRARLPVTEDPVDLAAAEAAKQAQDDPTGAKAASVDSFQRAVLRRYELPVAKLLADQAKETEPTDKDATSHRWAMTGDGLGTAGAPLGKSTEAKRAEPAKPLAPTCLSGVRKVGEAAPASCGG